MKYLLLFAFLSLSAFVHAQKTITGKVLGENNEALPGATIVLLEESDSTMMSFALCNDDGKFQIEKNEDINCILQISYLGFDTYYENISAEDKNSDVGIIVLNPSSKMLKEITISAEQIPMGVRGDTISYNASAFKTRPNATVEDLLRQLPGIEVERNGNIKAQGEDVDNVLVDGKEFFSGDPKMATKNLEAEAVDKVEVYDKKSEMAEFTGIGDGEEEKTINLKLKEDHKNGGFGNASLAMGTDNRYDSKLNYFRFSPKLQASVIGASNNINQETFSFNDRIEFMGGIGNMISGGAVMIESNAQPADGINTSLSTGINFNYDFSKKTEWRSHYLRNRVSNVLDRTTDITGFSENFTYQNEDVQNSERIIDDHQISTQLRYKANPLTEIFLKNNVFWNSRSNNERNDNRYFIENEFQGLSNSSNFASSANVSFENMTQLKRKFVQKGRSLITSFQFRHETDDSQDSIAVNNQIAIMPFEVFQNQFFENKTNEVNASLSYTEPLGSKYFASLDYSFGRNTESPLRNYFDLESGSPVLNRDLSANFEKNFSFHSTGINLRRNSKKLKIATAAKLQWTSLKAVTQESIIGVDDQYWHILPSLDLDYKIKGSKNLNLNYLTSISAPLLQQMAPFPNNTNANFAIIGNPQLIPEYRHRIGLSFNSFDNFNFTSFWANMSLSYVKYKIVNKIEIDDQLFQTIEAINTDNLKEAMAFINFSRPFRPLKINYRFRTRFRLAAYQSFINNLASDVEEDNMNIRLSFNNRKKDHLNIEAGVVYDLSHRRYGVNADFNQSFSNTSWFFDMDWYISSSWTFSSNYNYTKYSSESFADSPSANIWTVSLRKLLFQDRIELSVVAFDLLKQNLAYNRSGGTNFIQQSYFNQLTNYYMVGLKYKIGRTRNDDGGMTIEID